MSHRRRAFTRLFHATQSNEQANAASNDQLIDTRALYKAKGEEFATMCTQTTSESKTSNNTKENSETTTVTSEEHAKSSDQNGRSGWLCWGRGRSKPKTGRDLGVWDKSLEDRSNAVSVWFLSYLDPLLNLGSSKVLDAEDIGVPSAEDRAERAYTVAKKAWDEQSRKAELLNQERQRAYEAKLAACSTEQARSKVKQPKLVEPSIAKALVISFGVGRIFLALVYYIISALLNFLPVLILNDLVSYFESGQSASEYDGYGPPWAQVLLLGFVPLLVSLLQTRHSVIMAHCAVFARTSVSTMLYRKSLTVSAAGRAKTSTGQVVNMMSNDTAQLQRFLQFAGMTLVAPIQIIISLVLIYGQVGNATWVGVGYMLCLAPINVVVFSVVSKMRRKVLKYSDLRVKMMNEILAGIRIIKFYAWERPFGKEVGKLRERELKALTKLAYVTAIGFSLILLSAPIIQPILVFLTYVNIQDDPLDAATAFTTVALFNIMRFPFAFMPMGLLQFIQSKISLRRLERYLQLPELTEYVESSPPDNAKGDATKEGSVTIQHGSFSWIDPNAPDIRPVQEEQPSKKKKKTRGGSKASSEVDDSSMKSSSHSMLSTVLDEEGNRVPIITLRDINISVKPGSLTAVVGSVGSGKSSLLSAILGEMESIDESKVYMPRTDSTKDVAGFVSYCSQSPWVVNDTLRGNILFGREFDQGRYDEVVKACALLDDLAVLPAGDKTEIGERGINLSGGQKARVSLARALYARNTRMLLLDDPLSAVDAHVGEHLFSKAIAGQIGQGTTRMLVTHHVHFLPRCDQVIVMDHGRIKHQGTYDELIASGVDFAGAVDVSKVHEVEEAEDSNRDSTVEADTDAPVEEKVVEDATADAKKHADLKKKGETLVKEEEREEGQVAGSAYVHYAKAGGWLQFVGAIVTQGLGRGSEIAAAFWLALWADDALSASQSGTPHSDGETSFYLGIYALFGLLGVVGLTVRALVLAHHRLGASRKLHDDLTDKILRAPVSFFDVTPTGRILNRFAADMDKIDLQLTQSLGQLFSTIFSVLGALGAIVAATKGTFLVPLLPMGYIYYLIQKWFRKTSTELQRVNSIANSPIFADFSQTLSGTSTIRAYGEETRFFKHMKGSFDDQNASYVLVQLTNMWLGLRLDLLGGCIVAFIGGMAVGTSSKDFIPAGWLGLALSYGIEVTNYLKHGVRMIATLEAEMNSVERVLFYSNNIESEAPEVVPENDPDVASWPSKGEIEIQHASMRYRDGPLVLKDLSLTVKGGEKIGVVGRTGSGKSSLMVVLFRISELEKDGGKIIIDGVDTGAMGTSALRLNLSIIPQDPVMFSNSVRYNLDPFGTASDEELWAVLHKVQLAEVIAGLPNGLEEQVAEQGENFSQGQRQLLCIARSLLRNPKVLVMDEATASIDNTTDAQIQSMIRNNFADATVLTIAHRLGTIMDNDRILVLDDGRIAEFDSPQALLQREDGVFKAMVEQSRAAHGEDDV